MEGGNILTDIKKHPSYIYAEKVGKWYENQVSIMKENIALAQLRDWLLPMLMNGQATIEN